MIADVIVETKTRNDDEVFSYLIPSKLNADIKIGSIIEVPFGRRKVRGLIIDIHNNRIKSSKYKLKKIDSITEFSLPQVYTSVIRWVSKYYLCSLGEALELFLPPKIKNPRKTLAGKINKFDALKSIKLTEEQNSVYEKLNKKLLQNKSNPSLIHGVTGSGKTEIYLKLVKDALNIKKQVVILVPEIMLTPQTIDRFEKIFKNEICLMHSKLSGSEKYHCYKDFIERRKNIIIGPRSALLIPSEDIGLIIIDEEQEDSYKQEQNPKYHAVDLAERIAKKINALLVLGSATPRIETYHKAKTGIYDLYALRSRFNKLLLPPAEIIDLRDESKRGNKFVMSERLREEIEKTLRRKKQVLLFLNRRGSSTFVSCRECGYVANCSKCDIPLIQYSGKDSHLRCHHCDYKQETIYKCPDCKSLKIKFFGAGVEKVENQLNTLYPKARIQRVDSETIKSKKDYDNFYSNVKRKKVDIILGTQMLSKGHDFPDVDLVGIISADTGMHLPYFRSSEKTFRILTQVSGRSGRIHNVGRTIIQTYWPQSRAIRAASKHDYEYFYNKEIDYRKKSNYPPFSNIIRIISEDKEISKAKNKISILASELKENKIEFIGPGLCFFQRIHDRWRYHIIIKLILTHKKLSLDPDSIFPDNLRIIFKKYRDLIWDVDPVDLL